MKQTEVLIIGAGAAGLMAAHTLVKAGKNVTLLEARNRIGGRIHTLVNQSFFKHAELGAEFVHGNLPVTLNLLNEAGISYTSAHGEFWHYENGKFSQDEQQIEHWDLLMKKLNDLKQDTTIGEFLEQQFGDDKYTHLRESVRKYVSGYDTADPYKASCFALRKEWQNEDEDAQYRIDGGYIRMVDYLAGEIKANGSALLLNKPVKVIHWEHSSVEAITMDGASYHAEKLIIALPLGILQVDKDEAGAIIFSPAIPQYGEAIQQMGFGSIIKILLEFKRSFWEDEKITKLAGGSLKEMGFLLSNEEIPTWWTQFPQHSTVLTGWLGGPPARAKKNIPDEQILQQGIESLANIFKMNFDELKENLIAWNVVNWTADPFTLGSYAYDTVSAPVARKTLTQPINHTIYFAGEYLYNGPAMGTVEAALTSGMEVAKKLI
jgi:monoamine oxidase